MSILGKAFSTGGRRNAKGRFQTFLRIYGAGVSLWVLYAALASTTDVLALTIIFLSLMLVLVFLTISSWASDTDIPPGRVADWIDGTCAILSAIIGGYFAYHADAIGERITLLDPLTPMDILAGTLICILTLEATRRTVGAGLAFIVAAFILYNLFGDRLSGPLTHGLVTYDHFIDIMVFTTDGIFGVPLRVAATYVFMFVLFGTLLAKAGGSDFFFDLAAVFSGRTPGGPAKIAVVSSGLYGTISGSPTSDVVTTGAVTIPMMKRLGYPGALAGGVEVAASTGGSILPPVMGSAAFIMAEFGDLDYIDIVIAGIIPAALYYLVVYLQVHLRSLKLGLASMEREAIPPLRQTLKRGGLFIIPLGVVVAALVYGFTPTYVAAFGCASVIGVSWLRRETRLGVRAIFEALAETAERMVPVTGACAAAGLVIGGITMTGLAAKFSHLITYVSGNTFVLSLVAAAMVTIILGLGMPTASAYILAAVLVGPLLMNDLGIPTLAGHMFLLYFAVLSAMTPPVAVAAYAAAGIAKDNPMSVALTAMRLSLGAFVLPFVFIQSSGILMIGSALDIAIATLFAVIGLSLLAVASEGYWRKAVSPLYRAMVFAAALLFLFFLPPLLGL